MKERVGTCSICGGNVMGYRGAWFSVCPPPQDTCENCGAVAISDVIQMTKPFKEYNGPKVYTSTDSDKTP